jgi:hypothetical protein
MGHEAHVRFVDAHAEGDGGHHHGPLLPQEALLVALTHIGAQTGVVGQRRDPLALQPFRRVVGPAAGAHVDDPGRTGVFAADEGEQLGPVPVFFAHPVDDVGAVETGHEAPGPRHFQALEDVRAGLAVGGGRKGQARHPGVAAGDAGDLEVLGAEVVPPLGDAMGLIDGEQGQGKAFQQALEALGHQPLGGHVQQVDLPGQGTGLHRPGLLRRQAGIEEGRPHPVLPQGLHLVLHQGDQGGYHHPHPIPEHGRNLVADRFAAARGHQHEGVLPGQQGRDDLLLVQPEGIETKHLLEDTQGGARGWVRGSGGVHGARLSMGGLGTP